MNADEWSEIIRCHDRGESIKGIAERLGMSRNTVRRALSMPTPPDDHRRLRGTATDDVDREIRDLVCDDPTISIATIGRLIGWERSRTLLARKVTQIRSEVSVPEPHRSSAVVGLPSPATSFVGRREELRSLRGLIGEHRLVSVVGPGGIGKTRLAIQAADEFRRAFADGVRFVEFASVRSEGFLGQTLCDALALDNRDQHDRSPDDTLVEYLRDRRMLLVLDNCEHVVDGTAALVGRLLEETSVLRIIVTSREYLAIPGEYVFHLQPLPVDDATPNGAVELFTRRAAAALTGFELDEHNIDAVRGICRRLDGLPLAIELACTRLAVLSVDDLRELLDRRMSVLTVGSRDRTSRHRSLQATIDWSYELCSDVERILWARVSVFADGFDLATVIEVCADDDLPEPAILEALAALVAKSVVSRDRDAVRARFRLLESIREYGWGRLAWQERDRMQSRLLAWCVRMIRETAANWYGPDQLAKASVVQLNRGNIRAALHSAVSSGGSADDTRSAADALGAARFLWACGISVREHRMWLTKALDLNEVDHGTKARMFGVLALVQTLQGDRTSADYTLQRARALADREHDAETIAFSVHTAGLRDFFAGDFAGAQANFDDAERRYAEHDCGADLTATLLIHRGMLLGSMRETRSAAEVFSRVHKATEAIGEQWFHAYATYGLGLVALLDGDAAEAVRRAEDALRNHRPFGDTIGLTLMSDLLGWALAEEGSALRAAVILGAASSMWGTFGQQLYGSDHWNALRDKAVETAQADTAPLAFERAWDRGRAMSISDLLDFVLDESVDDSAGDLVNSHDPVSALSVREREVATLVSAGMTNKQIAEKLVLSTRTVEGHVEHLLRKLNVHRRTEVASAIGG